MSIGPVDGVRLLIASVPGYAEYRRDNLYVGDGSVEDMPTESISLLGHYAILLGEEVRMDDIRALFRTVETLLRDGDECLRNWLGTIFFEYVATEMRVLYRRGALTRTEILGILGPCSRQEWGCWLTPAPR